MDQNKKSILKTSFSNMFARLILIVFFLLTVYPFIWAFLSSIKTNTEFIDNTFALPSGFEFENYIRAWKTAGIGKYVGNSILVTIVTLMLTLVCVVPCSYCLSRYKFFGSSLILTVFMTCLFITGNYILIPLFLQMNKMKLVNSLWGLSLVYATFRIPYSTFLLTGYMRGIPRDYEEAAIIDGCGPFGILTHIIVPLSKPSISTIAMLALMNAWNEYTMAMVMLTDDTIKTLPVGLAALNQLMEYATDWVALFAALVIAFIPSLFIYLVSKKQLLQGVNVGGIKG